MSGTAAERRSCFQPLPRNPSLRVDVSNYGDNETGDNRRQNGLPSVGTSGPRCQLRFALENRLKGCERLVKNQIILEVLLFVVLTIPTHRIQRNHICLQSVQKHKVRASRLPSVVQHTFKVKFTNTIIWSPSRPDPAALNKHSLHFAWL